MSPVDWFYARGNKQMGPVSALELKRLATNGELTPDDLVWREGLAEWTPAKNVRGLFDPEAKPAGAADAQAATPPKADEITTPPEPSVPLAPRRHLVDWALDSLRSVFDAHFIEAAARLFRSCGLYGLFASMLCAFVFAFVAVRYENTLNNFLRTIAFVAMLVVLHYVAGKMCDALDRLNGSIHGKLASAAFPNCVAALSLVAGLFCLFDAVSWALGASAYSNLIPGIGAFIVFGYLAFTALNPSTLNVEIDATEPAAAQEWIAVVEFLLKALLRLVPVAMGVGVAVGLFMLCHACYDALAYPDSFASVAKPMAAVARETIILSGLLPLFAYLAFLLANLVLGIWRAILGLPARLDRLDAQNAAPAEIKSE